MNINHAFAEASDEISFMPGDIITNVEMVDEGWWKGTCHGRTGLFPATFVELNQLLVISDQIYVYQPLADNYFSCIFYDMHVQYTNMYRMNI